MRKTERSQKIDIIVEDISNKSPIQDLPTAIQKDFGILIKTERGVVTGIHHMQDHHVLLQSKPKFQEIFARAEMSIDDYINSLHLPDKAGKSIYPTNKSQHSGMHSKTYYLPSLEDVTRLLREGERDSWTPAIYRQEILQLTEPLKEGLNSGKIQLNNSKPLLETVNKK